MGMEWITNRFGKGDPVCHRYGEEREAIEHCLFFCKWSERTWHLAPVNWVGIKEMRYKFFRKWEKLQGSLCGDNEIDHIAIIANILWQKSEKNKNERTDWRPPTPRGVVILNSDAVFQNHSKKVGWGIVARDLEGKIVASWAVPGQIYTDAVIEEVLDGPL
ncbi:hypothetical protein ACH5RR_019971 [Cinchona calisaya]|uniref:Reverse transcriptase zinc-binding domain-containing protein n=1 Tax=Cinchona calisaya TaxID=153742 RepID=A0ABD2ZGY4_9GENT